MEELKSRLNSVGKFSILLRKGAKRQLMKNLNEDLKTGNIKQAYLLYGEEAYLKKQYRDRLTKAVLPEGDTVNYAHYEGKGINVPEIIDLGRDNAIFCRKASHCD